MKADCKEAALSANIRDIQHYLYCKHRWGLLKIGSVWAENYYVTKANLLHQRVHDADNSYNFRGRRVFTAVAVYNDLPEYNLYGVVDCLEAKKSAQGIILPGLSGKYQLSIVEYKPTQPKGKAYNEEDLMQVLAQKICVDYVFQSDCDAYLYYSDTKRRILLPLKENYTAYRQKLLIILAEMRTLLQQGKIPPKERKQKCSGCSIKDICLPSVKGQTKNLKARIKDNFLCESY